MMLWVGGGFLTLKYVLARLKEARGYVVVGAFVIAAVVTPPDVVSQFLLAVPLCVLYEIGILVARGVKPRSEENADAVS